MTNIDKAKDIFSSGEYTCVLCNEELSYMSTKSGVAPMVDFISRGINLAGYSAADKIIGKAAAMLFIRAGVAEVYADVMSIAATKLFEQYKISYTYGVLTEKIINRSGNGICPMEQTVADINDVEEGCILIKNKLEILRKGLTN